MHRPDHPVASPAGAASTSRWRRRVLYAGCLALIGIGALIGLMGLLKVQGVEYPLNVELRQGCLADPSVVAPRASCAQQAEAILRYPDGRTEVVRGSPQEVQRRVARATDQVRAAERRRGVGYLLVATLLVGGGIVVIVRVLVRRGPPRSGRLGQAGGHATRSRAG